MNAMFNANLYQAWTVMALIGAVYFVLVACRYRREGFEVMALRVQLGYSLGLVLLGDAISRAMNWLYWERVVRGYDPPWLPSLIIPSYVGAVSALIGTAIAIRAISYDRYGNRLWLLLMAATAVATAL